MPQFFYFFIRFKIFWVFVIFEAISLILVFNGNPYHRSVYINSANGLVGGIYSSSSNVKQYFHLKAINDSLVAENARLYTNIYSKDSLFHVHQNLTAHSSSHKNAVEKARNIDHKLILSNSTLHVNTSFSFPIKDKLRDQEVEIIVEIPKGKSVKINNEIIVSSLEGNLKRLPLKAEKLINYLFSTA